MCRKRAAGDGHFLFGSHGACDSQNRDDSTEPAQPHGGCQHVIVERRVGRQTLQMHLPLLLAAELKAYRISVNPCGPGLRTPATPALVMAATAVPSSTTSGVTRMAMQAIFISNDSIFLPRYSGVLPIMRPANEDCHNGEYKHVVKSGTDASEYHFTQLHEDKGNGSSKWGQGIHHAVDRATGAAWS